ncbi:hypothetical protein D3C80_1820120 [compost metagenome]
MHTHAQMKELVLIYFGSSVQTVWGICYVVGFDDNEENIILIENGEKFTISLKDFFDEVNG